ncbi:MAG: hypothetical protein E6Q95_01670 [Chitinophagaceae bacterium]|nr:MAG: hypothetical protein E6Q95_01670 [Chitinophagaceae bacterium]
MISIVFLSLVGAAQCSLCTKNAQQLGDGPAQGMNTGIMYLAFIPVAAMFIIGYKWWKYEKKNNNI